MFESSLFNIGKSRNRKVRKVDIIHICFEVIYFHLGFFLCVNDMSENCKTHLSYYRLNFGEFNKILSSRKA